MSFFIQGSLKALNESVSYLHSSKTKPKLKPNLSPKTKFKHNPKKLLILTSN